MTRWPWIVGAVGLLLLGRSARASKSAPDTGPVRTDPPDAPPGTSYRLVWVQGYGEKLLLRNDAAEAYGRLLGAARRNGIREPLLRLVSGYRTRASQEKLWQQGLASHNQDARETAKWVAHPGGSAHETGRAGDFWMGEGTAHSSAADKLRESDAWKWMDAHAHEYGWNPYVVEPWHWEFGKPHDSHGIAVAAEVARGRREGFLT